MSLHTGCVPGRNHRFVRIAAMPSAPPAAPTPPKGPRHWPTWLAVGVMVVAGRLPWPLQRGLGRVLGALAYRLVPQRRHAAETNLSLCFPDMDAPSREALVRASFRDLGVGLFEFARAWWGSVTPMRRTVRIETLELARRLQRQRASRKGAPCKL